jgi:hypothetical protein
MGGGAKKMWMNSCGFLSRSAKSPQSTSHNCYLYNLFTERPAYYIYYKGSFTLSMERIANQGGKRTDQSLDGTHRLDCQKSCCWSFGLTVYSLGLHRSEGCVIVTLSVPVCSQPWAWWPSLHATAEFCAATHAVHTEIWVHGPKRGPPVLSLPQVKCAFHTSLR